MCYTSGMPQQVIDLPVVWIYILHLKCEQYRPTMWPSSFICACVHHFQTTGNFRGQLWCPTACLHNISTPVFVMYPPSPSKKRMRITCQIFAQQSSILLGGHCHSIQHCLEVLLEMGPPWFSWRPSQIELAHVCFASTRTHKRHSHRILTQGIHAQRPEQSQPRAVFL